MVSVQIQIVSGSIPRYGNSFPSSLRSPQTQQRLSPCDHGLAGVGRDGMAPSKQASTLLS